MASPLQGIRVVDFGRYIAAPYCGMVLADLGADVIRVERREGGEDRSVGPITSAGEGGMFLNLNRNKRGITLSLGSPGSEEVVRRLVERADIVIVNLPAQTVQKVGLEYAALKRIKEDIIVMATAFGSDGPYADRVGFDGVAQAMSGAMHLTGFEDVPVRSVVPFVDYGTALHAAAGAMAALYQRRETGRGQLVEVSLLETSVTYMLPLLSERAAIGKMGRSRQGNAGFFAAPSDTYTTRDGWIIVATVGNWMFTRWAKLMGRAELIADARFEDDRARADNYGSINEIMAAWCAERTRQEAVSQLEEARIPCGPVYDLDEVLDDPQVRQRGLLEFVQLDGEEQPVPLAQLPVRLGELARQPLRAAPRLGEHTDAVLEEIGFTPQEIAHLREREVV